jgi:cation transport ATPase
MAIKEKNNNDQLQQSRLIKILSTEYKWETYVLGILGVFALALGLLMLTGVLTVKEDTPIIGQNPKVFEWIIVGLAVVALVLFAIPFFRPAGEELKKLTPPTWRQFVANATRVFIFLIVLTLLFLLFEAFITAFLGKVM